MQATGQTMPDASGTQVSPPVNRGASEPHISLDQIKESGKTINIFSNSVEDASTETAATTNEVKQSRVGFLISTGVEYADEGEYEEAENAYLRALEVDDQNPEILSRLAALYVQMDRFREAADIFKELTERFPENPMTHNNLAWCYATGPDVRNKTLALRHAREALLYAPLNPSIWNTLAESYYMAGDYDKAFRSAEHALELLQANNPSKETLESFVAQLEKIALARDAWKMLEGIDDEE